MEVIYELSKDQIEDLHDLYKDERWTNSRSLEETIKCVHGSQICIGLIDSDGVLIGFVRVLTDFIFKALIFDLIIKREFRGQGLSKKLMSLVKTHENLKDVRQFELYCLPELEGFYKKLEFSGEVDGLKLLRCNNG